MSKTQSRKQLRKIGMDIQLWEHGRLTLRRAAFYVVVLMLLFAVMTPVALLFYLSAGALIAGFFICAGLIAYFCRKLLPGWAEDNWPDAIDRKLSLYQPCNHSAWQCLQEAVKSKGGIEKDDLRTWYDDECRVVFRRTDKPLPHFLENTPGKAEQQEDEQLP